MESIARQMTDIKYIHHLCDGIEIAKKITIARENQYHCNGQVSLVSDMRCNRDRVSWGGLWEIYAFFENWKPELHTFKSGAG